MPNFTPINDKTVTKQKTVNLVSHPYSIWRDINCANHHWLVSEC